MPVPPGSVPFRSVPFLSVPFRSTPRHRPSREPNKRHQFRHRPQIPLIAGIVPPALQPGLFQQRHAGQPADEEVVKQRTEHEQVAAAGPASRGRHVQAEPQQDLAEVVRVSADGPQACADELTLWKRVEGEGAENGISKDDVKTELNDQSLAIRAGKNEELATKVVRKDKVETYKLTKKQT